MGINLDLLIIKLSIDDIMKQYIRPILGTNLMCWEYKSSLWSRSQPKTERNQAQMDLHNKNLIFNWA